MWDFYKITMFVAALIAILRETKNIWRIIVAICMFGVKVWNKTRLYFVHKKVEKDMRNVVKRVHGLSGYALECKLNDLMKKRGYKSSLANNSEDAQFDIILAKGERIHLVECKCNRSYKISLEQVRQFHVAIKKLKAQRGFFLATGSISQSAMEYANEHNICLIAI